MSFKNTMKCMQKVQACAKEVKFVSTEQLQQSEQPVEWVNDIGHIKSLLQEIGKEEPLSLLPETEIYSPRSLSFAHGVSNIETIRKKQLELKSKMNDTKPKKPMKPKKVIISNIANTKTK